MLRITLVVWMAVCALFGIQGRPSEYSDVETSDPDSWRFLSWLNKDKNVDLGYLPSKRARNPRFPVAFSKRAPHSPLGFFPDESPMATRSFPMATFGSRFSSWDHLPRHKDDSLGFFPSKRSPSGQDLGFLPSSDSDSPFSHHSGSSSSYRSPWSWHPRGRQGASLGFLPSKRAPGGSSLGFLPDESSKDYQGSSSSSSRMYGWPGFPRSYASDTGFFPSSKKRAPQGSGSSDFGFLPAENSVFYSTGTGSKPANRKKLCHVTKSLFGISCCEEAAYGEDACECVGPYGPTFFC